MPITEPSLPTSFEAIKQSMPAPDPTAGNLDYSIMAPASSARYSPQDYIPTTVSLTEPPVASE